MKNTGKDRFRNYISGLIKSFSDRKNAFAAAAVILLSAALVISVSAAAIDVSLSDQNQASSESLSGKNTEKELSEALETIKNYETVIREQSSELSSLKDENRSIVEIVDRQQQEIENQQSVINDQQEIINGQQEIIDDQQEIIDDQQNLIKDQKELIEDQHSTIYDQINTIDDQQLIIEDQQETISKTDDLINEINDIIGTNIDPISAESMYEGLNAIEETQEVIVNTFNDSPKAKEYVALLDETKAEITENLKYYPDFNPTVGKISYTFGNHTKVSNGVTKTTFHRGLDIFNKDGGPIYAAAAGTVTQICTTDNGTGLGLYVRIDHGNGYMTLYGHLKSISVTVGQKVEKGQVIAEMGRTGAATGTHLHFEVYLNGELQDPENYVSFSK